MLALIGLLLALIASIAAAICAYRNGYSDAEEECDSVFIKKHRTLIDMYETKIARLNKQNEWLSDKLSKKEGEE